jgi:hypothetical protein
VLDGAECLATARLSPCVVVPCSAAAAAHPRDVPVSQRTLVQKIAVVYWVGHYAKRILETFFVHT